MSLELLRRRRAFLKGAVVAGIAGWSSISAANPMLAKTGFLLPERYAGAQDAAAFWAQPRTLNLHRQASGEHRVICYWRDGSLDMRGYREACHLLRDVKAGQAVAMDIRLLNLLRGQQGWLEQAYGFKEPFVVTSGYRSPGTNNATEGAAKDSLHQKAMAADGRYLGLPIKYQGELMVAFKAGGVGLYVSSKKFIHTDVGNVRTWIK